MNATLFSNDDTGYLQWLARHPNGFVVNMRNRFDPDYLVLHRSRCATVNRYPGMESRFGGFTERAYQKLCATSVAALDTHLRALTGRQEPFSKVCSQCWPL